MERSVPALCLPSGCLGSLEFPPVWASARDYSCIRALRWTSKNYLTVWGRGGLVGEPKWCFPRRCARLRASSRCARLRASSRCARLRRRVRAALGPDGEFAAIHLRCDEGPIIGADKKSECACLSATVTWDPSRLFLLTTKASAKKKERKRTPHSDRHRPDKQETKRHTYHYAR